MLIDVYAAEFHYEKALGICYWQRSKKQCFDSRKAVTQAPAAAPERELPLRT